MVIGHVEAELAVVFKSCFMGRVASLRTWIKSDMEVCILRVKSFNPASETGSGWDIVDFRSIGSQPTKYQVPSTLPNYSTLLVLI